MLTVRHSRVRLERRRRPACLAAAPMAEAGRFRANASRCCSSSVVEHSLGKGEVESSILSCSTINYLATHATDRRLLAEAGPDVADTTRLDIGLVSSPHDREGRRVS